MHLVSQNAFCLRKKRSVTLGTAYNFLSPTDTMSPCLLSLSLSHFLCAIIVILSVRDLSFTHEGALVGMFHHCQPSTGTPHSPRV